MSDFFYLISHEDWSLHRKGHEDQARHREKVKQALQHNLVDLVSEEGILTSNGSEMIRIPIRSLEEFRFRYNYKKQNHIGSGDANTKKGDVIAKDSENARVKSGQGSGAGDQPGVDYYESEVTLEEIENHVFSRLKLPNLNQTELTEILMDTIQFNDIRKKGIMANLDKKRTILEAMKRNMTNGQTGIGKICDQDLRFKTWNEVKKPYSQAVVLCMMDTSGSMGSFEKDVARTTFFWISRFLRQNYHHVEIVFIAHHTQAKIVSEEHFFTKGEMGGTVCSSAYKLALELIRTKYPPSRYNIYPIHFSDGDNLPSDNDQCIKLIQQMLKSSQFFAYGEINQHHRTSTLGDVFKSIEHPMLKTSVIFHRKDILKALETFFSESEHQGVSGA